MADKTIPKRRRRKYVNGVTVGRLIDNGDFYVLTDRHGNSWHDRYVSIVSSFWGGGLDGSRRLPRLWKYNTDTGAVIVRGDLVLIDFLDGNPHRPIIRGCAQHIAKHEDDDDFFAYNHNSASNNASTDTFHLRLTAVDGDGVAGGSMNVKIDSGTIRIAVGSSPEKENAIITISSGGTVTVNAPSVILADPGSTAEAIIKGETFQTIFNAHVHGAAGTPPTAPLTGLELSTKVKTG